ncbi:hypothetical protein [Chryseobacterium aureum]|uniref:hypothetical protein n=1 Tax=Chryseobacterium aureum TaxID=2497456 RepID=UPI000F877929|nr:hypothetical protein [Chryseobacterium aureum]
MEIFSLKILTIINILYFLRTLMIIIGFVAFSFLVLGFKHHNLGYFVGWASFVLFIVFVKDLFNYLKKIIITKTKYPLPLNLLCNILRLGKPYYFGEDKFNLDEIISDNKLPVTFYYINNHQHPILQFNKNKILFHGRDYDWKTFNWKYFFYSEKPYSYSKRNGKYIIEFTGIHKDNIRIKNKIEFEKIKADENEVILLFIIHDLLFGTKASYYY